MNFDSKWVKNNLYLSDTRTEKGRPPFATTCGLINNGGDAATIRIETRRDLPEAARWLYNTRDRLEKQKDNEHNRNILICTMYALLTLASICDADLTDEQFIYAMKGDGMDAINAFFEMVTAEEEANDLLQERKDAVVLEMLNSMTISGGNE